MKGIYKTIEYNYQMKQLEIEKAQRELEQKEAHQSDTLTTVICVFVFIGLFGWFFI